MSAHYYHRDKHLLQCHCLVHVLRGSLWCGEAELLMAKVVTYQDANV